MPRRERPKTLPPVRPNEGIRTEYRRRLDALVREMNDSVVYWLSAAYKANEPEIAQDALPASVLRMLMKRLSRRWNKRFDALAPRMAEHFATAVQGRSDAVLMAALKRAGFAIEFRMTRAQRDVMRATVNANVGLIKSIPRQYLAQVEGSVMRSVQSGRDLKTLVDELRKHHGVSKRRAAFIARDQNNKATSALARERKLSLGIEEELWLHSAGGNEPRPTHVANTGKPFNIRTGWYDPALKRKIFPGQEPNCGCVSRSIIPKLTQMK